MKLRLHKLQAKNKQAQKTKVDDLEGCNNINGVLYYQGLSYIPEIIQTELISIYHDNPLAGHFGIKKIR